MPKPSGPGWSWEETAGAAGTRCVAGCDEAGRGPLAGPVVAAAVVLPRGGVIEGLNDSKKLDPERRQAVYERVLATAEQVGVGLAPAAEIDRLNILRASLLAMARAVRSLGVEPDHLLVDGNRTVPLLAMGQEAVIKGDGRSMSIAAASVVAKVTRDAVMERLDRLYPGYGFAAHKGYPCAAHLAALRELGPCAVHRTCYAPVRALLPDPPPLPPAAARGASTAQLALFDEP